MKRLCNSCGIEKNIEDLLPSRGNRLIHRCYQCERKYRRSLQASTRREVISHYSDDTLRCGCCGENRFEFLTLDHVEGGGNAHRREVGKNSIMFWRWLKNQGYPPGYRVLCYNCNLATHFYGVCPHKRDNNASTSGI